MIAIVCADQKKGTSVFGKRQSRDLAVLTDILGYLDGKHLFIQDYSEDLFLGEKKNTVSYGSYLITEDFHNLGENDVCFVELSSLEEYVDDISVLILYTWDKVYPSDIKLSDEVFEVLKLASNTEIKGNTHEVVIKEVYERV